MADLGARNSLFSVVIGFRCILSALFTASWHDLSLSLVHQPVVVDALLRTWMLTAMLPNMMFASAKCEFLCIWNPSVFFSHGLERKR